VAIVSATPPARLHKTAAAAAAAAAEEHVSGEEAKCKHRGRRQRYTTSEACMYNSSSSSSSSRAHCQCVSTVAIISPTPPARLNTLQASMRFIVRSSLFHQALTLCSIAVAQTILVGN
jgi:hypothetical protein